MWHFQTGNILRGGIDEPVAIETELCWVVSGPLKCGQDLVDKQEVQVKDLWLQLVEFDECLPYLANGLQMTFTGQRRE